LTRGAWCDGILVFLYDRERRTAVRVRTAADGTLADEASRGASLSADGRHVAAVSSADNLVPGDANGVADVFVKDLRTGANGHADGFVRHLGRGRE
jgi:hypothetical protein